MEAEELRETFGKMLVELARENPNILVLDGDLNTSTRTDIFLAEFPKRFVQCGIAEQNMFGIAAGLAAAGCIPFPTTFAVFATKRACDQISISIAYPKLNVKIPGCYPGLPTGKAGASHQSTDDLAIMRSMPNMRVLDPGDATELRQMMRAIVAYDGPVYFRVTRPSVPDIVPKDYHFEWAKSVNLRKGADVTLIGTGFMTYYCMEAAGLLAQDGIQARVDHHPCLKPIDKDGIIAAAKETGCVVTAENHGINGGLGSAVAEVLVEGHPVPMERIGIRDVFVECGEVPDLFVKYRVRPEDIAEAARNVIARR